MASFPPILSRASRYSLTPGDSLILSGQFLTGAKSVTIGGVSLAIVHNTATQVVVTVPAPAPSGQVVFTNAVGTATMGKPFSPATPKPPAPPPPAPPSQQGADAAAAYTQAYDVAKDAAEKAYEAAGGDSGGVAAHVAAQAAAASAAQGAVGPGQSATGKRAASDAYNDFKTKLLTDSAPKPGINPQGGASGGVGGGGAGGGTANQGYSPEMQQLLATLNQWMAVIPEPLRVLATVGQSLLHAAARSGISFPASRGLGGAWSTFNDSMQKAAKEVFDKQGGGSSYGPHQVSPFGQRVNSVAGWFGKQVGKIGGQLGLTDAEGVLPPAMAGAITSGIGALILGSVNNVKGSYEAGAAASRAFTDGVRSGFGALDAATRDFMGRIIAMLGEPFGKAGAGIGGIVNAGASGLSGLVHNLVELGAGLSSVGGGILSMGKTIGAGAILGAVGMLLGGPAGGLIGVFLGTLAGLISSKITGFFTSAMGNFLGFVGKAGAELLKVVGEVASAFVQVISDVVGAGSAWASLARGIANNTGMSDGVSASYSWGLQGLGLSGNQVQGMFSPENNQFNRALTQSAWGVGKMPLSGDFDSFAQIGAIYEKAQKLRKDMGPLGAMFQQSFLNSTGNGAMLNAVNLSPDAFYERLNFSRQFDPSEGKGDQKVKAWEEGFGTLSAEIGLFVQYVRVSFGTELLPFLKEMFSTLTSFVKSNKSGIVQAIKDAAGWVFKFAPSLILNAIAGIGSALAQGAMILGKVLIGIGTNMPAIVKMVNALLGAFRNIAASSSGWAAIMADAQKNGWGHAATHGWGIYNSTRNAFLRTVPKQTVGMYVDTKAMAKMAMANGKILYNFGASAAGQKQTGSPFQNMVPNMKAFAAQARWDPKNRNLLTQIAQGVTATAQNTGATAQNTGAIPSAMDTSLRDAVANIVGVARLHDARDRYYAARRA